MNREPLVKGGSLEITMTVPLKPSTLNIPSSFLECMKQGLELPGKISCHLIPSPTQ